MTIFVAIIAIATATQAQGFRINVVPAPTAFDLKKATVSNGYDDITLSGSEEGMSYHLYRNEYVDDNVVQVPVGSSIAGTGKMLTFKVDTSGNHGVFGARNDMASCQTEMKGSVSVEKPKAESKVSKMTIKLNGSSQQKVYCLPGVDTIVIVKPDAGIFGTVMGTNKSLTSSDPKTPVIVPKSKSSSSIEDESVLSSETSAWFIAIIFLFVFVAMIYGIRNRLSGMFTLGDHKEIKPPYSGKVYSPKYPKK